MSHGLMRIIKINKMTNPSKSVPKIHFFLKKIEQKYNLKKKKNSL